jgi:hypothetical protein
LPRTYRHASVINTSAFFISQSLSVVLQTGASILPPPSIAGTTMYIKTTRAVVLYLETYVLLLRYFVRRGCCDITEKFDPNVKAGTYV